MTSSFHVRRFGGYGNLFRLVVWRSRMFANSAARWYHSNQYSSQATCQHCGGVVRHEKWCITCDPLVRYAFSTVEDCAKLNLRDHLMLHALGVCWRQNNDDKLAITVGALLLPGAASVR
jgi:hypothetical protein